MPIDIHQPEQKPNSELKDQDLFVSPAIGNTPVVGSQTGTSIESVTPETELKKLSVEFNNRLLEFEKKHNNKWNVYTVLPKMSILPIEAFENEPKFKLTLVYS